MPSRRLVISAVFAALLHVAGLSILSHLEDAHKPAVDQTMYIRLTPQINHQQQNDTKSTTSVANAEKNFITTTGQSPHQAPDSPHQTGKHPERFNPPENIESVTANPGPPVLRRKPRFTSPSSEVPGILPNSDLSFSQYFTAENTSENVVTQISTRKTKPLTPYEKQLMQHLAKSRYYNRQFEFSRLKKRREVELLLVLQQSGAVERAQILQSSGLPDLDQATIRSAYLASPFPKPPKEDRQTGYTYELNIAYQPKNGS